MSFSPPYTPTLVEPVHHGQANNPTATFQNNFPHQKNGNFYWFLYDDLNGLFYVAKSVDNLMSFSVLVSSAHVGVTSFGWQVFLVGDVIHLIFENNGGPLVGALGFMSFDCATETLTDAFGLTGSPSIVPLAYLVRTTDGHYIIGATNIPGPLVQPSYYEFNPVGNVWSGPFDLFTNTTNVTSFTSGGLVGQEDSTGLIHWFFSYRNSLDAKIHLFYQQLNTNDTLGHFFDFGPGQGAVFGIVNPFWGPMIDTPNGNIVLSLLDTGVNPHKWYLLSGTPIANPVFAPIANPDTVNLFDAPKISIQNGKLYAITTDDVQQIVYLWTNNAPATPLTGWSAKQTVFDAGQTTIPGWQQQDVNYPILVDI